MTRALVAILFAVLPAAAEPHLPQPPGERAPSFAVIPIPGAILADVDTCDRCHADVVAQWRTSAHGHASFSNPVYRLSVDRLRAERGFVASRFCGGCHDPALLADGALDGEVAASDARAHAGVTCRTCHSIAHVTRDGNGSYGLDAREIELPAKGSPGSRERHMARVAPPLLRQPALCASCHKVFLDPGSGNAHHLAGQDDATPYWRSTFAGSDALLVDEDVPRRTCQGCHMPLEEATRGDLAATDGKVASHRFLGGHTWLQAMRRDAEGLAAASAFLRGVASIDVTALVRPDGTRALPADGAAVTPGERVILDVVVRNLGVGHRFPGGTLDAQGTRVEVTVSDARGRTIGNREHDLRAALIGDDGRPLLERETHRFRAVVWNHTLLPRDATVIQYELTVPAALPLAVTARLIHRTRNPELARAACADARTPRARSFFAAARAHDKAIDACAPLPEVEIARADTVLGGAAPAVERPLWRRLYDHALGLTHALQERLDEARPSLTLALALAPEARDRAMVLALLASIEAAQGRAEAAEAWLDLAETLAPGHPALARLRGQAYANVWRWYDAIQPLWQAAMSAPSDDSCWTELALAAGSAGDDRGALAAAWTGLALQPRDPDLLRVQALSLRALGARSPAAEEEWLRRRIADDTPRLRAACSKNVPGCARERNPVHIHSLPASEPTFRR